MSIEHIELTPGGDPAAIPDGPAASAPHRESLLREIMSDKMMVLGIIYLVVLLFVALTAPWLAPYHAGSQDLEQRLLPPFWMNEGTSSHVLGTDHLGRDVLSRMMFGARISILVGFIVVLVAGAFGVIMGLLAGYLGGRVDRALMLWIDAQISFPVILLILLILAAVGPSITTIIICICLTHWMIYARTMRSAVLSMKHAGFVEAAVVSGARTRRVVLRHILPNLIAPLLTLIILEFAGVILVEAALSFLGVGIQPPSTSWGLDVSLGRDYIFTAWWLVTFPGLALALTVLSLNLVSSGLRVLLDPTERNARFARRFVRRKGVALNG